MNLHWHRRDLRVADNRALAAAAADGDFVLPMFVPDHAERRERAISTFERARSDD